jgi:hypothetical protein
MQAAGFVEGYLTAPDIFNHWYNQRWWLSQKTNDTYKVMNWCGLRTVTRHTAAWFSSACCSTSFSSIVMAMYLFLGCLSSSNMHCLV